MESETEESFTKAYEAGTDFPVPFEGKGLPPELKSLPPEELRVTLRVVRAHIVKKTKSKELAEELMQDVFVKIVTTRRWDPLRRTFRQHYYLCAKSEMSHRFSSKAPEKEAEAREGFHREELPTATVSVEDAVIREETEAEEAALREANAVRELELLRGRAAHHELMPKVISCFERGIDSPRAIAAELRVPVDKVYDAIELVRRNMKKIRETLAGDKGEEKT